MIARLHRNERTRETGSMHHVTNGEASYLWCDIEGCRSANPKRALKWCLEAAKVGRFCPR